MKLITVEILGIKLEAALLNSKVTKQYEDGLKKVADIAVQAMECTWFRGD